MPCPYERTSDTQEGTESEDFLPYFSTFGYLSALGRMTARTTPSP